MGGKTHGAGSERTKVVRDEPTEVELRVVLEDDPSEVHNASPSPSSGRSEEIEKAEIEPSADGEPERRERTLVSRRDAARAWPFRTLSKTLLKDWLPLFIVESIALVCASSFVPARVTEFNLEDPHIMYSHMSETVSMIWLAIIGSFIPISIILLLQLKLSGNERGRVVWDGVRFYALLRGLLLAMAVSHLVTSILKVAAGRLRPDFLARCDPVPASVVCSGELGLVEAGRRSFPSGHSSSSFVGLSYASVVLAGELCIFGGDGGVWRLLVSGAPIGMAVFVAVSRLADYRHHELDVIGGAVIGGTSALLSYRYFFPSVMGTKPEGDRGRPYQALYSGGEEKHAQEESISSHAGGAGDDRSSATVSV